MEDTCIDVFMLTYMCIFVYLCSFLIFLFSNYLPWIFFFNFFFKFLCIRLLAYDFMYLMSLIVLPLSIEKYQILILILNWMQYLQLYHLSNFRDTIFHNTIYISLKFPKYEDLKNSNLNLSNADKYMHVFLYLFSNSPKIYGISIKSI